MKTTYRFKSADFVGLGHRAYQCEIIEVDEETGFERPAFIAWGKTREDAIKSANRLISALTFQSIASDWTQTFKQAVLEAQPSVKSFFVKKSSNKASKLDDFLPEIVSVKGIVAKVKQEFITDLQRAIHQAVSESELPTETLTKSHS